MDTPTPKPAPTTATTRFSTRCALVIALVIESCAPSFVPAGGALGSVPINAESCLGNGSPSEAHEMLSIPSRSIVVGGGASPIETAEWNSLSVGYPWQKNTTRHLLFTSSCFFRSPGVADSCTGQACFQLTSAYNHSWISLAQVGCLGCLPDNNCGGSPMPSAGHLRVVRLEKCHRMVFDGTVDELLDPWGGIYVMHASGESSAEARTASIARAQRPAGWTARQRTLVEPLTLTPRTESGRCIYTIIRDDQDNSWHQHTFGTTDPITTSQCS